MNPRHSSSGFTLIESVVVISVLGVIFAMGVPSFLSYRQSQELETARQALAGQLRLGRQKAIGMRHAQTLTFSTGSNNYTVQDLVTNQTFGPFKLPKGLALEQASLVVGGVTGSTITALPDGRFSGSGDIIIRDRAGRRDTVSVQVSGLVASL